MGIVFLPSWMRNLTEKVKPYDWLHHECDGASVGIERCPVCGKGRHVKTGHHWDEDEQRYVDTLSISGCDCPPIYERK